MLVDCRDGDKDGEGSGSGETETPDPTTPSTCEPPDAYAEVAVTREGILPSATAAPGEVIAADDPVTEHSLVLPPAGLPLREELFVWLPGSGYQPRDFTWMMNIAAAAGYRGVSFAYRNEVSVNSECGVRGDPECDDSVNFDCEEQVRTEIVYGDSVYDSPCVTVSRADSIENRLIRLLQYLDAQHPTDGYGAYLDGGDAVAWEKIVIAGWSQGGGHAGLIARDHRVARALFISKGAGAVDQDGDGLPEPALWADDPRATPPEREFGSTHEDETAWEYSPQVFETFGMTGFGDYVDVDGFTDYPADYANYRCTHLISTAAAAPATCPTNDAHPRMAADDCLSLDGAGVPILAPAYYYFLTTEIP